MRERERKGDRKIDDFVAENMKESVWGFGCYPR